MVGRNHHSLLCACILWLLTMPVLAQSPAPSDPQQPFIEVELEPNSAYVQSMVRYTIRLYRNSHLQRGYFMDQEIADTVTELSRDTPARYITRGGREYELLERHYLLFPQRSGEIILPRAIFSSRDLFVQGPETTLTVRPRPNYVTGTWLPAMGLQLSQSIDRPEGGIHSGMQIRRTIGIQARGLTGAQLPSIAAPKLAGMEIQDLESHVKQQIINGVMTGERKIQQLLIPRQGGDFILPEVKIQWWDSIRNTPQTATLAATTMTVLDSPAPQTQSSKLNTSPHAEIGVEKSSNPESTPESDTHMLLLVLLLSVLAYGLLIWHYRVFPRLQLRQQISVSRRRFKQACRTNDPAAASSALLSWGVQVMGEDAALSVLGFRKLFPDPAACAALLELDRAMYSTPESDWSGMALLERVSPLMNNHKQSQPDTDKGALPTLYG